MQLRSKYYPFPVIVEGGDYYDGSSFSSKASYTIEGYSIHLLIETTLSDSLLSEMVKKNDVVFAHHIECPQTCFREVITSNESKVDYLLNESKVDGIVQVCSFLIANKDLENYSNPSFSKDYKGWTFSIDKGCVLAVGKMYSIRVNKMRDDLANTSSIISIIKDLDPMAEQMKVSLGKTKIEISLPRNTFNQYSNVQAFAELQPAMHSMVIIPALIYVFSVIKATGSIEEFEENRWFIGLSKALKKMNIDLNDSYLPDMDVMAISQMLINNPISAAIDFCALGADTDED